uniref:Uncharacterized protein n=1 Tax=Knipowitschia caucasica TaxID=637954 RepID=A0AAV2J912_KNICA
MRLQPGRDAVADTVTTERRNSSYPPSQSAWRKLLDHGENLSPQEPSPREGPRWTGTVWKKSASADFPPSNPWWPLTSIPHSGPQCPRPH